MLFLPEGKEQIERFDNADDCHAWLRMFEHNLETQQWKQKGGPSFLLDGWPTPQIE